MLAAYVFRDVSAVAGRVDSAVAELSIDDFVPGGAPEPSVAHDLDDSYVPSANDGGGTFQGDPRVRSRRRRIMAPRPALPLANDSEEEGGCGGRAELRPGGEVAFFADEGSDPVEDAGEPAPVRVRPLAELLASGRRPRP